MGATTRSRGSSATSTHGTVTIGLANATTSRSERRYCTTPPIARTSTAQLWTDERVAELNAEIAKRPFRGMVLACPYMPDLQISSASELDRYAKWITEIVIPHDGTKNATYEVRQKEALDWPLATASVALKMKGSSISSARVAVEIR